MAFTPIKTYRIATSGTHSTIAINRALLLTSPILWQVRITTKTADAAILFGTSAAAAADVTVASDALADGNTHFLAGTIELINLPVTITHISAEAFAAGTGEVWITIGFGERI